MQSLETRRHNTEHSLSVICETVTNMIVIRRVPRNLLIYVSPGPPPHPPDMRIFPTLRRR